MIYTLIDIAGDIMSSIRYCVFILSLVMLASFASAQTQTSMFNGAPKSGNSPPTTVFTDASIGIKSAWVWFFGDEAYTQPWINITGNPGWTNRERFGLVVMPDGSIILMGGINTTSSTYYSDVWRSTDEGVHWTQQTANAPWGGRSGLTSVAMPDGSIVLMGGTLSTGVQNDTWRSIDEGVTWTLVNASSGWKKRDYLFSVVMPDGSIVIGAGALSLNNCANDTWRSTDEGAHWTLMNASPGWMPREIPATVSMPDGNIILAGGWSAYGGVNRHDQNDTWKSTDNGATWTEVNASSGWLIRDTFPAVRMPDNSIVIMGGGSLIPTTLNDTWRSNDEGSHWTEINERPGWEAREGLNAVTLPDGSIVLIGGNDNTNSPGIMFNDTWRMQPAGILRSIFPNWLRTVFLR